MAPIPPPPGFMSDETDGTDFIPPPPSYEPIPPPPGLSLDSMENDQGWLEYLGNLGSGFGKKVGASLFDTQAGITAAQADLNSGLDGNSLEALNQAADERPWWQFLGTPGALSGGYQPMFPASSDSLRQSAKDIRGIATDLNKSADAQIPLDPNGTPRRLLDMTAAMAGPVVASMGSPMLAPLVIGGQSFGQKYNALDQMVDENGQPLLTPEQRMTDASLTGGLSGLASLAPMSFLGTSTGNFGSRLAQEYLKQGAVNGLVNPLQTIGEALIDSQAAGIATSPQELMSRVSSSVGDAWLMAAPFSVAGATGARRPQAPRALTDADFNQTYIEGPSTRIGPRSVIDQERPRSVLWDRSYLSERPMQGEIPLADGPAPAIGDIVPVQDPSFVGPQEGFSALDPLAQAADVPLADSPPQGTPQAPDGFSVLDPLVKAADASPQVEAPVNPAMPVSGFRSFDALRAQEPATTTPIKAPNEGDTFSEAPVAAAQRAAEADTRPVQTKPRMEEPPAPPADPANAIDLNAVEVPVKDLSLSSDVPQFKRGANARGVVEPLQGKYDRRSTAPIAVWRRNDGRLEVISGRHRLDLAQRSGEETIPAQIYDESKGFSVNDAVTLDAELNIRDQSAKVYDMANYYRRVKIDPTEAESRGMLSREDQRMGYDIGNKSTDETFKLYENEKLNDRQAALIARTAPEDATLQSAGAKAALRGEPLDFIKARMRVATKADRVPQSQQRGMFEGMESVERVERLQDAEANVIVREQRKISERLNTIRGAAKRPEMARQEGLPPDDPAALANRVRELELQKAKLDEIHLHPDLHGQITEQALSDLNGGTTEIDSVKRSIEAKTGQPAFTSETGAFDPLWFINMFRGAGKDFTHFDISESNKAFGEGFRGFWNKRLQWMDTTMRKFPQATRFIKTWWAQPEHEAAIRHNLGVVLKPYTDDLIPQERQTVDNYLAWARHKGKDGYQVSELAAKRAGLNDTQAKAAVAVREWSDEALRIVEARSVERAHHEHWARLREITTDEGRAKAGDDLEQKIADIRAGYDELRGYNYVPFSRFGDYYVTVTGKDGDTLFRSQFDKDGGDLGKAKRHLQQLARDPKSEFFGGKVESGRTPPPPLSGRDGISADLLDLLDGPTSGDAIKGFSKHFKQANLVPGQTLDLRRSIAEYNLQLSKYVSMQRAEEASGRAMAEDLHPVDDRNLERKLSEWSQMYRDKQSYQKIDGLFNFAFIWGNARVALSDMIGRATIQYPLIGKYAGALKSQPIALAGMAKEAAWYVNPKLVGKDLSGAIEAAQKRGVLPTHTHRNMIRMAEGQLSMPRKAARVAYDAGYKLKELSENSSRIGAFIWGWDTYPTWKNGAGRTENVSRQEFAENFVREGQAVPTQLELPPNEIFTHPIGKIATKFRRYQIKIAKSLIENAGSPGYLVNFALASYLATGLKGLPGYRDVANLFYDPEEDLRAAGARTGVMNGWLSDKLGIDLSGTAGYGAVVPTGGTALQKFMLGVAGAPFEQANKAIEEFKKGHYLKSAASAPFMPGYVKESLNVADWNNRGLVATDGTRLIAPENITPGMKMRKFFGWTPIEVADKQLMYRMILNNKKTNPDSTVMNGRIGEALHNNDVQEARRLVQQAREQGIKLNEQSIKKAQRKAGGEIIGVPKDAVDEVKRIMRAFD